MTRKTLGQTAVITAVAGVFLGLSACSGPDSSKTPSRQAISAAQAILADVEETELTLSPELVAQLDLESRRASRTIFVLDDHSQAGFERRRLTHIELWDSVRRRPVLPPDHPVEIELSRIDTALEHLVAIGQFGGGRQSLASVKPYPLDPYSGVWIEGPHLLARQHDINTADQAEAYLSRLTELGESISDVRRRLIADEALGKLPPALLLLETADRIDAMISGERPPLSHLNDILFNLTGSVDTLEPDQRQDLLVRGKTILQTEVRPAYLELAITLRQIASRAPAQLGLSAQPKGHDLYQALLTFHLGEPVSLDTALQESASATEQLKQDLKAALSAGLYAQGAEPLLEEPRFADLLVTEYAKFEPAPPSVVGPLVLTSELDPAPETPVPLKSVHNLLLMDAAGLWPPLQTRIRAYQADAVVRNDVSQLARRLVPYASIHSGLRRYALAVRVEAQNMPQIADQHLVLIQSAIGTADIGMHHARWSQAQTQSYLEDTGGLPPEAARAVTLWITANPGQEGAAHLTRKRLSALSARSRTVLGDRYDQSLFEATLLKNGARPLQAIEADVDAWYGGLISPPSPQD